MARSIASDLFTGTCVAPRPWESHYLGVDVPNEQIACGCPDSRPICSSSETDERSRQEVGNHACFPVAHRGASDHQPRCSRRHRIPPSRRSNLWVFCCARPDGCGGTREHARSVGFHVDDARSGRIRFGGGVLPDVARLRLPSRNGRHEVARSRCLERSCLGSCRLRCCASIDHPSGRRLAGVAA